MAWLKKGILAALAAVAALFVGVGMTGCDNDVEDCIEDVGDDIQDAVD